MFDGKLMEKLKKKKKSMHPIEKDAKLDVLKDLSEQAGDAMAVKIMAKPEDMEEALDMAKDKVEDIIEMKEGMEEESEDDEMEDENDEMEEPDGEGDSEEMMADMGEDMVEKVEDYSNVSKDELDAKIEKLMKIREKMKVASMD